MSALALSLPIALAVGASLAGGAWLALRGASARALLALLGILVVLLLLAGFFLADSVALTRLMPVPCLPVCGNLTFPLALVLAGSLMRLRLPLWRRLLLAIPVGVLAMLSLAAPLTRQPPVCDDQWTDGVCLQTDAATCSAAAAATLLRHHGIAATEQEMARLSLTSDRGTSFHGLFRALLIKTKGAQFRPRARRVTPSDPLRARDLPAIVRVKLTGEVSQREPRYAADWGWQVGMVHSVVVLGFTGDRTAIVADPAFGREEWDTRALQDLMLGDSITLCKEGTGQARPPERVLPGGSI